MDILLKIQAAGKKNLAASPEFFKLTLQQRMRLVQDRRAQTELSGESISYFEFFKWIKKWKMQA